MCDCFWISYDSYHLLVTIQNLPTPHSHFEHFVFFPAFSKAKNAHMGWGVLFGHLYV